MINTDGSINKDPNSSTNQVITTPTITGGTISGATVAVSDYQYIPIDAGMDSIIAAPAAAARLQGTVGNTIAPTVAAGVNSGGNTWTTLTPNSPNLTTAVWAAGTPTLTWTIAALTVGKLYRLQFTPTVTGQVPSIAATSGIGVSTIPVVVTAVVENIYFRATGTTAVFTASNTATSTWSTASTTCFEYSRPAIGRDYSNSVQQSLAFDWIPPPDWNAGTITVIPYMVVSAATAPATTETVIWSIAGFCVPNSGSLGTAIGTGQTSTFTADATFVTYDEAIGPATAAITLPGAAAGSKGKLVVDRLTTGTYAQLISLTGVLLKFGRTLAP